MSEIGMRTRMLVKDVMTSPVVTIAETAAANKVAELMLDNKVGCVIVVDKMGQAIGIVTERDLVARVLAKNLSPSGVKAKDFMTSTLPTTTHQRRKNGLRPLVTTPAMTGLYGKSLPPSAS